jgi:hypothetical protein
MGTFDKPRSPRQPDTIAPPGAALTEGSSGRFLKRRLRGKPLLSATALIDVKRRHRLEVSDLCSMDEELTPSLGVLF